MHEIVKTMPINIFMTPFIDLRSTATCKKTRLSAELKYSLTLVFLNFYVDDTRAKNGSYNAIIAK